jgi:ABC-type multidrug transport system ATPase subunit
VTPLAPCLNSPFAPLHLTFTRHHSCALTQVRRHLGVCPQHNVLYPNLTVEEHLLLFASFKGLRGWALKEEVRLAPY